MGTRVTAAVAMDVTASGRRWRLKGDTVAPRYVTQSQDRGREIPQFLPSLSLKASANTFLWPNYPEGIMGYIVPCNMEHTRLGNESETKLTNGPP